MTEDVDDNAAPANSGKAFKAPPLDDPKYRAALADDIKDEDAARFLHVLDSILRGFVDLGFGVDAVQLAIPELAKFSKQPELSADFSSASESIDVNISTCATNFNSAAQKETPQKE